MSDAVDAVINDPELLVPAVEMPTQGADLAWLPAYTSDGRAAANPWDDDDLDATTTTVTQTTVQFTSEWRGR